MTHLTYKTLDELRHWMPQFVQQLQPRHLILLNGPLGVGKTAFVQVLWSCLNAATPSTATSPTFTLHHTYLNGPHRLEHIDLYRHKNIHDIESTGLWDVFEQDRALVLVEWADRLPLSMWPCDWPTTQIELSFASPTRPHTNAQPHAPRTLKVTP